MRVFTRKSIELSAAWANSMGINGRVGRGGGVTIDFLHVEYVVLMSYSGYWTENCKCGYKKNSNQNEQVNFFFKI